MGWLEEVEDFKYRHNIIPMPEDGDSITKYLLKLSSDCLHHEKETQWWRSLQSFIHFLRNKKLTFDETGYLNTYFPKQMEVKFGQLIKTVENANFSLDVHSHSRIIHKVIDKSLKGPKQGRRGHAELLGFILTALSLSWYRLPTTVEKILDLSTEDLEFQQNSSSKLFHTVNIPTDFGEFKIPISPFHSDLLLKLAEDNSDVMIFRSNRNQISKILQEVLKKLPEVTTLGPIWLTTFLQRPHEVIAHRYQLQIN